MKSRQAEQPAFGEDYKHNLLHIQSLHFCWRKTYHVEHRKTPIFEMIDIAALVHECAPWAPVDIMTAIVRTESRLYPHAIGVNGKRGKLARPPANRAEAVATAKWLIGHGYNIDMGLGQINSANLGKLGLSVDEVFEPCTNVRAAATIYTANLRAAQKRTSDSHAAVRAALSMYNTGSATAGLSNGYVSRVMSNYTGGAVRAPTPSDAPPIQLVGYQIRPMPSASRRTEQPDAAPGEPAREVRRSVAVFGTPAAASRNTAMVY